MRTMLASSARLRQRFTASAAVRPLCRERGRPWRNEALLMNDIAAATQTGIWRDRIGALRWLSLTLLVILMDQLTKAAVVAKLELFDVVKLLPVLELTHLQNTGAAFSLLAGAS